MAGRARRNRTVSVILLICRIIIRISCYVLLVFLVMHTGRQAYRFGYSVFHSRPAAQAPGRDVAVTITEDMSGKDIAKLLKDKGLIRDENVFRVQEKIYGYKIYPGTYVLNTSQKVTDMLMVMSTVPETAADDGKTVIPKKESDEKKK